MTHLLFVLLAVLFALPAAAFAIHQLRDVPLLEDQIPQRASSVAMRKVIMINLMEPANDILR